MSTPSEAGPALKLSSAMRLAMYDAGYTVTTIARELEVTRFTVNGWLQGHRTPSVPVLMAWAMVTGVNYKWLCAIRDSNPEPADLVTRWAA
jgi:transcriptional regulator with XRE-family HTH domain